METIDTCSHSGTKHPERQNEFGVKFKDPSLQNKLEQQKKKVQLPEKKRRMWRDLFNSHPRWYILSIILAKICGIFKENACLLDEHSGFTLNYETFASANCPELLKIAKAAPRIT